MISIESKTIEFSTNGRTDIIDITDKIDAELATTKMLEGNVTVFAIGSTTGITTIEYEPGLVNHDLAEMYQQFAPYDKPYEHNNTWGDDNGGSHLRSALQGSSMTVPFINGKLMLGTWQQIVFIDFDTRSRSRKVVLQFLGEKQEDS